jgi:hypothetical protein
LFSERRKLEARKLTKTKEGPVGHINLPIDYHYGLFKPLLGDELEAALKISVRKGDYTTIPGPTGNRSADVEGVNAHPVIPEGDLAGLRIRLDATEERRI